MVVHQGCLCCSNERRLLFHHGQYHTYRCIKCGQAFVEGPQLDYNDDHYFNERNNYQEQRAQLFAYFQELMQKVRHYCPNGKLLDVGCSVGILLEAASQQGYEVTGVELSKWASEFARQRGLNVRTGSLLDANYPDKYFDVVVLNHVLEHLPQPVAVLGEAKRILKDEGMLVIGVPNFGSFMARLRKGRWTSFCPEQHIWQFTRETLTNLLNRAGFVGIYFEAKDNHSIHGWGPKQLVARLIAWVSVILNNSEAMLIFARKIP